MITGQLIKTADGYKGFVASLDFDLSLHVEPNVQKNQADQPDFIFSSNSPIGRKIRLGAGWSRTSQSQNDYISITLQVGSRAVRINAVTDEDAPDTLRIIPWTE